MNQSRPLQVFTPDVGRWNVPATTNSSANLLANVSVTFTLLLLKPSDFAEHQKHQSLL